MEILVCIKQVPGTALVEVDERTGVLKRDGVEAKLNPYDLFALELGLRLAQETDGHVTVITMGPSQARAVLEEAVCIGADRGFLISDRQFAGADVCATSYTLYQGIERSGDYDLILCGKQTTDGDTAQVGPEVAEFMGIPHSANILGVRDMDRDFVTVEINMEQYILVQKIALPCLLTVDKDINTPRLPSYKRKKAMDPFCITSFTMEDFADRDKAHYGLKGSPTQVERIFPPEKISHKVIWEGGTEELAAKAAKLLRSKKFVQG
ncbi:MAG: electron transfer flavoprotein subunit beta/FixA family protein [Clostridium sp.]|nr:electron transfer flavoprotein subunit beta/FixA family protein [Clostridium sp.]